MNPNSVAKTIPMKDTSNVLSTETTKARPYVISSCQSINDIRMPNPAVVSRKPKPDEMPRASMFARVLLVM